LVASVWLQALLYFAGLPNASRVLINVRFPPIADISRAKVAIHFSDRADWKSYVGTVTLQLPDRSVG